MNNKEWIPTVAGVFEIVAAVCALIGAGAGGAEDPAARAHGQHVGTRAADAPQRVGGGGRLRGPAAAAENGQGPFRRAQELFDEIRRRSGEQSRPEVELDYLRRLLDRF